MTDGLPIENPDAESFGLSSDMSPAAPGTSPGLFVKTFGCMMNEYDSEKVIQLLSTTHQLVDAPEKADVLFINTCSVRQKGEHKLFSLLGSLRELKAEKPGLIIGVGGCVAQQEGEAIAKRNSLVDFVVGTHNLSLIPSLVRSVKEGRGRQVAVDYREDWEELPEFGVEGGDPSVAALLGGPRALVSIQRGCNKKCSFCVVPTTRGPEVSRPAEEILREARLKVRLGAKEVLLLGQTVNSYGRDLAPRYPFEKLITELASIEGLKRIRFTSPHPAEVRPGFLELYGSVPQLCPHIHLPLQSGSDRILKLMNRNYRVHRYLAIVDELRARCPGLSVTSDAIVGFPTETDADFRDTLKVMNEVRFQSVYSFKYSRRPNTVALDAFQPSEEVPDQVSHERLLELQAFQEQVGQELNSRLVGTDVEVLVEESKPGISSKRSGRTPHNVSADLLGRAVKSGELVMARVQHAGPNGIRAFVE